MDIGRALGLVRSSAIGLDDVSPKLLKLVASYVMPILEHIYNYSFMHGVVPV